MAGSSIEASKDPLPVIIQADALPGPDKTVRVAVSLGAHVTQKAVTRARIVAAGGGTPYRLVGRSGSSPAGDIRAVNQTTLRPGESSCSRGGPAGVGGEVLAALARSRLVVPDL